MTVVCGTDFSDNAEQAAEAAAALAQLLRVPLKLVHVLTEAVPGLRAGPAPESLYYPALAALRSRAEVLRAEYGVEVEPIAVHGTPHEVLTDMAGSLEARLIVVSALGAKRQHSWLLGSVAERVAQSSSVPVLVVRDGGGLRAWARGDRTLRVLVAADLGSSSRAALDFAAELRRIRPCDLTIAQIAWPFGEQARLGMPVLADADRLLPEVENLLVRDLRGWAGGIASEGGVKFLVSPGWGRVDTHLTLLAAEEKADLIAVGMHQRARAARFWFGSVSSGVVHCASANVVCVPRSGASREAAVMAELRSILVPTDLSELGNRAVGVGYGLAAPQGLVHLLHVESRRDGTEKDARERLTALIPRGAASRGVATEVHVVHEPDIGIAIWQAASRLGVDAICMSTHSRSGLSAVVLGSEVQEVVRRARQPVVLVPPDRES